MAVPRCRDAFGVIGTLLVGLAACQAATAKTCANEPVTARGEPARYEWLALTKARSNWRVRVRRAPTLGTLYASWTLAEAKSQDCATNPAGIRCSLTAVPCKP